MPAEGHGRPLCPVRSPNSRVNRSYLLDLIPTLSVLLAEVGNLRVGLRTFCVKDCTLWNPQRLTEHQSLGRRFDHTLRQFRWVRCPSRDATGAPSIEAGSINW